MWNGKHTVVAGLIQNPFRVKIHFFSFLFDQFSEQNNPLDPDIISNKYDRSLGAVIQSVLPKCILGVSSHLKFIHGQACTPTF